MSHYSRRDFVKTALVSTGAGSLGSVRMTGRSDFYRVSTEETFAIPEVYDATTELIEGNTHQEAGLDLLPRDSAIVGKLMDLGEGRIADMDRGGIDRQLLSLWSPGLQIFEPGVGTELAKLANDRLADAIKAHPDRFAGLVSVAPQDPDAAAQEIERGINRLGLHGVIINSYTKGQFLDNPKFWPIFEAAQSLDAAIYIHPRKPAPSMYAPFGEYGMDGPMWGFHMDASTHAVRLLLSGVFDEFPRLRIVLGHMGEGLPFWLNRLDEISSRMGTKRRRPSEYFLDNFVITTSAMFWDPILELSLRVLGADRILFGIDYPFASNEEGTRWLDAASVSNTDKAKIYAGNANRVFGLEHSKNETIMQSRA